MKYVITSDHCMVTATGTATHCFGVMKMADKLQLNANGKSFLLNFFVNFFVNIELYCSNACLIIFLHCDNFCYSHITPTGGRPTVGEQNF